MLQKPDLSIVPDPRILQLVRVYAWLCNENSHASDEILTKALSQGKKVHPGLAYQAVVFTPIAFTHYLLRDKINFSATYIVMHPETEAIQEYPIHTHPVYHAAYYLAPELEGTMSVVAIRSAEFGVINNTLLNTGKKTLEEIRNFTVSPPVISTRYSMHELPD